MCQVFTMDGFCIGLCLTLANGDCRGLGTGMSLSIGPGLSVDGFVMDLGLNMSSSLSLQANIHIHKLYTLIYKHRHGIMRFKSKQTFNS
jgi:hypothetical protein